MSRQKKIFLSLKCDKSNTIVLNLDFLYLCSFITIRVLLFAFQDSKFFINKINPTF